MERDSLNIEQSVSDSQTRVDMGPTLELLDLELALVGGGIGNCELG
jgi:hypothetical protein